MKAPKVTTLNHYQAATAATADFPDSGPYGGLEYLTLGVCGEAGEVAEKVKKQIRRGGDRDDPAFAAEVAKEIGDVLWYLSRLSARLGFSLETIAQINLEKTYDRKARGVVKGTGDSR